MPSSEDDHTVSNPQVFWSTLVQPRLALTEGISPRDKTGAVARARQTLNNELSAFHLAICSLRSRCNALSPISVFPAEVLVRIFQFHAMTCPPSLRSLGWIKVTHICRLWRDTTLQFPSLWSNICYTVGPRWAELMLARSTAVPISFYSILEPSLSFSSLVSKHLHHTRDFRVLGSKMAILRQLYALPCPSAILKDLGDMSHSYRQKGEGDNFELPGATA